MKHVTEQSLAYQRARNDIASLLDWIDCEAGKLDNAEINWAHIGSLKKVKTDLMETLRFISGVETEEIQRNLDELHG